MLSPTERPGVGPRNTLLLFIILIHWNNQHEQESKVLHGLLYLFAKYNKNLVVLGGQQIFVVVGGGTYFGYHFYVPNIQ